MEWARLFHALNACQMSVKEAMENESFDSVAASSWGASHAMQSSTWNLEHGGRVSASVPDYAWDRSSIPDCPPRMTSLMPTQQVLEIMISGGNCLAHPYLQTSLSVWSGRWESTQSGGHLLADRHGSRGGPVRTVWRGFLPCRTSFPRALQGEEKMIASVLAQDSLTMTESI